MIIYWARLPARRAAAHTVNPSGHGMVVVMIVTRKNRRDRVRLKEAAESVACPAGFDPPCLTL